MKKYVAKRLAISVLLIFIISVFSFMLIHILPGDPARLALGYEASEADVQAYRVELHLDKPLVTQYVLWIKGLFQGNFGRSILYNRPNLDILAERLPRTLGIGLPALLISIPLGILVGVICAVRRGKAVDILDARALAEGQANATERIVVRKADGHEHVTRIERRA